MDKFLELIINKGVYSKSELTTDDKDMISGLILNKRHFIYNIDIYCKECGKKRIFHFISSCQNIGVPAGLPYTPPQYKEDILESVKNQHFTLVFLCSANPNHKAVFNFITTENELIKIGQYPSYADMNLAIIKQYKSILGSYFIEYSKAIKLYSYEVGIGAFVYLRRIIEKLIFDKYEEFEDSLTTKRKDFNNLRFNEKIECLKEYLPNILVKNKNVYGIVSKGIHELSEDECLNMFPAIKSGIELVLDDIIAEKKRVEKEKEFTSFVAKTTRKLKE